MTDDQVSALLNALSSAMPERSVAASILHGAAISTIDCGLDSVINESREALANPRPEYCAEHESALRIVLAVATFEPSEHE